MGAAVAGSIIQIEEKSSNKARSKQKIDGMVALIIALSRVIACAGMGSVYNTRAEIGGEASIIRSI